MAEAVARINWYHTLDLGEGLVTPGFYDHRGILPLYGLPERLDGMRVLDIACFDGFWSFEFERRGAAEVIALDIRSARELDLPWRLRETMTEAELDRPFGEGFRLAHEVLGSAVKHTHCNVYDLSPERLGRFDFVHCGDLLLHLRDPARALYNIRRVTRGTAMISDCIYPDLDRLDGLPIMQYDGAFSENIWWRFSAHALSAMIRDAGFDHVAEKKRFRYGPRGEPASMWHAVYEAKA
ncbi:class I SAM-dependent methyltransferase [Methylobacterium nodulans]|uniref:class I SAM-dependent methyltransferase n=1 Tax=Methylobacterium nodulans TaxID=114616 RepID=UPI0002E6EDFE|nr:methyltransferase domain-containing protein [Methylobacterium nodulans]